MPERLSVTLIDDEAPMRHAISQWLDLAGFEVIVHDHAASAIGTLTASYDGVVVTDLRMEGIDGMALLGHLQELDPDLPVVMITGHGDIQIAVDAMRRGAYDFVEKPFEPDRFLEIVRRAIEKRRLVLENRRLRQVVGEPELASRIIGNSRAIETLRMQVAELAGNDASVVIYGETGAGKDLVARCLHDFGPRSGKNYVAINCAAVPDAMAESEFFGHESGAFTGATKTRPGKIEHAQGGTLFLDEVDSMPLGLQGKLLRVLQERQIERLGSNRSIAVDFRTIAASKIDLEAAHQRKEFRQDLYYRLCVAELHVPPLRQRKDDIPLLFEYFSRAAARSYGRDFRPLGPVAADRLIKHNWPGNVRELRNAAERHALGLAQAPGGTSDAARTMTLAEQVEAFERAAIEQCLIETEGRINLAMEKLGLPRRTLTDKMSRYGLDRRRFSDGDGQKSAGDPASDGRNPQTN